MKEQKERIKSVAFIDQSIKDSFEKLKNGTFEEQELANEIIKAIDFLKENPKKGIVVPTKLWPKEFIQKFQIDNLRKYDLPNAWRMLYTLHGNDIEVIAVIIEWNRHKIYDRRMGYKTK